MLIHSATDRYPSGYTSIIQIGGEHKELLSDFGILCVDPEHPYNTLTNTERAFLILDGNTRLEWMFRNQSGSVVAERTSLLEQDPLVLQVPAGTAVTVTGTAEIAIYGTVNSKDFAPRVWQAGQYRSERLGQGTLQDCCTRRVRTFFDAESAPESSMVMGEVVSFPGKWSSYPPHRHAQPEIYHFRFFPAQGFGFTVQGDEVFPVRNLDTMGIPPNFFHPIAAAPGYAMYYIWMIPHLPDDKFGPSARVFAAEHEWLLAPNAPIWSDV